MEENNLKTLQLFYAAALVDSIANYGEQGILEKVTAKKAAEQAGAAPAQLQRLGIGGPAELFKKFSSLFGCVKWEVSETAEATEAAAGSCLMCAIAKQRGTASPCDMYCINPFKGFARALGCSLEVRETLWEGGRCLFSMKKMRPPVF